MKPGTNLSPAVLVVGVSVALLAGGLTWGCDSENACGALCPSGSRFTSDGTCTCVPFDAGYCAVARDCPDAYCPASDVPGACGVGQAWSTTICSCYPLPNATLDATTPLDAHADR